MALQRISDTSVTSHINTYKIMDTYGPTIMTVAASFSQNNPSTMLRDHRLQLEYLQPRNLIYTVVVVATSVYVKE
jgi:hypothetical protein